MFSIYGTGYRSSCGSGPTARASSRSGSLPAAPLPPAPAAARPVRVQWSREDELRWAPFGSAMAIRVRGGLDDRGGVAFWRSELWSHTHSTRPGREAGFD